MTKKRVRRNEPEMSSTADKNKDIQEDSGIADADQIQQPVEVFDSAKYNSMSDMTQGATLDTKNVETMAELQKAEEINPRQIGDKSLTADSRESNNPDNIQSPKITPMTVEERARTIREANEEMQSKKSPPPSISSSSTSPYSGKEKFVLYLNLMLSMENAAVERLHARIPQSPLEQVQQQLIHHLEETREQKERLISLITLLGGQPTEEQAALPSYSAPKSLADALSSSAVTREEQELKTLEEDALIENAEIIAYNTLIQMASKMNIGEAIPPLRQNLQEEEEMAAWARASLPSNFVQLWMKNW
jgi:ferritin-like metal-binding protein YciE